MSETLTLAPTDGLDTLFDNEQGGASSDSDSDNPFAVAELR